VAQYGAAPADLDLVAAFAARHELRVLESNPAQRIVVLSGTVAHVNKAFAVELGRYEVAPEAEGERNRPPGQGRQGRRARESYRGYEGEVHLPPDVAHVVEGVFGLDNRRMAQRAITPLPTITPLTPPQVAALYDFPTPGHHIGKETIGLLEFSDPSIGTCGYLASDINAYFTTALGIGPGFIVPTISDIGVNGATNSPGGPADAEVTLDISVAGSVAQGAHINVYFTTWDEAGWVLALKRAVHPHPGERRPSVLSISWDWAEFDSAGHLAWTPAAMATLSTTFQEAAMFGTTVFVASGDDGSNCQVWDGKAHVYYPESDPWVTSCGGTTIGNVAGSSFVEVAWTDNGITGGGISDFFDLPHWQRHANIPLSVNPGHRQGRGVPDIAGYANGYEIVLGGVASPGWWGTSETAPLYAALIAIINGRLDERVGYLNPFFYSHHAAHIFRDIADGRTNATGGAPGYVCGPGWDGCTGLGSINGRALLKLLRREEFAAVNGNGHVTGKVAGLVFDRFGDFEGFVLEDLHGGEHRFVTRESEIRRIAQEALANRILTEVLRDAAHKERPLAIVLRSLPDHP
jgi:kumamolisin